MSEQIAVRLPDALAAELDRLVRSGMFPTKASAIRSAIQDLVETERRRRIGEAIADGYRRSPPGDDPELERTVDGVALEALRGIDADERGMAEEPW